MQAEAESLTTELAFAGIHDEYQLTFEGSDTVIDGIEWEDTQLTQTIRAPRMHGILRLGCLSQRWMSSLLRL